MDIVKFVHAPSGRVEEVNPGTAAFEHLEKDPDWSCVNVPNKKTVAAMKEARNASLRNAG